MGEGVMKRLLCIVLFCMAAIVSHAEQWQYDGMFGWPLQKQPEKVIVCRNSGLEWAEQMLLESLSGLAAQAVNEGRWDTMVWIDTGSRDYNDLLSRSLQALGIVQTREMNVWELLDLLKKQKVVKGYVSFTRDASSGHLYSRRENMNYSSNVATVYCSLMKGALVEKSIEDKARAKGLRKLKDADGESMESCFVANKDKLNNRSALSIDPQVTNCRDIAIAQKLMLYYDTGQLSHDVLEWVRPLSPIMGWNCGNEDEYTGPIARWSHYNTASNWCCNLPLLSAASQVTELRKMDSVKPEELDWNDDSSFHSFLMSDGDNMQWTIGNFVNNEIYYANKDNSRTSMSWTLCPVNLSVMSASTWNQLSESMPSNSIFIEYGGGYEYPDEFAVYRENRSELLREFAKRLNYHFKKMNITVFGCICKDVNSEKAKEAFQIFAEEIENLAGIVAVQYYPYELGGDIIWVTNKNDVNIPVVTARYCIWEKTYNRPLCGTPDYVGTMLNRDVMAAEAKNDNVLSWTVINAWSHFDAESNVGEQPNCGYNAGKNAEALMLDRIKVIPIDELLWRIRMKHFPEETKRVIERTSQVL